MTIFFFDLHSTRDLYIPYSKDGGGGGADTTYHHLLPVVANQFANVPPQLHLYPALQSLVLVR